MTRKPTSYVEELRFCRDEMRALEEGLKARTDPEGQRRAERILDYPTVYVISHPQLDQVNVYVGESSDIRGRTTQHIRDDVRRNQDWNTLATDVDSVMYIIGHDHFNKSLTLDVENRLMHWLSSVPTVKRLYNGRGNPQNKYHTRELLDPAFRDIWTQLRRYDDRLFPTEQFVRDSALFKASPFHQLTQQQLDGKAAIMQAVRAALETQETGLLILVKGAAGSGKTVLLSSLFYELFSDGQQADDPFGFVDLDAYLLVNHDEQLTVYQEMAKKLCSLRRSEQRVSRPTGFINRVPESEPVDVVLIDEAHLLWTQGNQGYRGKNQLADILKRAKVVVAVFDEAQVLATNQYWEEEQLSELSPPNTQIIHLDQQMRIRASVDTISWLRRFIDAGTIGPIPTDPDYDLQIFSSAATMYEAVKRHATDESQGLSRLLATFDWEWSSKRKPADGGMWEVKVDTFHVPWNLQIEYADRHHRAMAWAERSETINECGSHYTIQGFDLNYAAVILGPSVTLRGGRVTFDPSASANKRATRKRTLASGETVLLGEQLLRNEINVLLTRGVNGLYLFACDPALREALLEAQQKGRRPWIPSSN